MAYPFVLPDLPYAFGALEPHIDARTMEIHHDKHHAAYTNNVNKALEPHSNLHGKSIEELLRGIDQVPETIRTAVRNNGGGYANHSLFWTIMAANAGGEPAGSLAGAIGKKFGSFADFKAKLTAAGAGQFGSGWGWLVVDGSGAIDVYSSANQDSPLMKGHTPILGVDVWEHAYYLKYQNRRPDYLSAWWNTVNWPEVQKLYDAAHR
jgi:Fe-Mn family superoxide dismutase